MKNSSESADEVLVTPHRMEKFLMRLANLRPSLIKAEEFLKSYSEFFPADYPNRGGLARYYAQEQGSDLEHDPREFSLMSVTIMARKLRKTWDEPDQRLREWHLYELRKDFHLETSPEQDGPPALTPFERAIFYLQRNADRARNCAAGDDCPARYFFAKSKRPQRFCSPICAGPAKREAKLKWWNEKGRKQKERKHR